jgi:hypothetical protein
MQAEGRYIEIEGPGTALRHDDRLRFQVDCVDFDEVYVHVTGPRGHDLTLAFSEADARGLARELKKAAKKAARDV